MRAVRKAKLVQARMPVFRMRSREALENRRLKAAIAQALEECWDGTLPFTVLEHALEPSRLRRKPKA